VILENLAGILGKLLGFFEATGYFGVFFLMFIESSFIPFPSEVAVPPAGYLASQGKLSIWLVVISATLGSLFGALFNYYLAMKLGRPLVFRLLRRWGKFFFLSEKHLARADIFWQKHGHISTFTGRLIPGVRQLISIPAGFSRMPLKLFVAFTTLGAFIWCSFLAFCGYFFGKEKELLEKALSQGSKGLLIFALVILGGYAFFVLKRKKVF